VQTNSSTNYSASAIKPHVEFVCTSPTQTRIVGAEISMEKNKMKMKIEITMDSEAFRISNGDEAGRILEKLATRIRGEKLNPTDGCGLLDLNGNFVGTFKVTS
jgi:hypothetical protein